MLISFTGITDHVVGFMAKLHERADQIDAQERKIEKLSRAVDKLAAHQKQIDVDANDVMERLSTLVKEMILVKKAMPKYARFEFEQDGDGDAEDGWRGQDRISQGRDEGACKILGGGQVE